MLCPSVSPDSPFPLIQHVQLQFDSDCTVYVLSVPSSLLTSIHHIQLYIQVQFITLSSANIEMPVNLEWMAVTAKASLTTVLKVNILRSLLSAWIREGLKIHIWRLLKYPPHFAIKFYTVYPVTTHSCCVLRYAVDAERDLLGLVLLLPSFPFYRHTHIQKHTHT